MRLQRGRPPGYGVGPVAWAARLATLLCLLLARYVRGSTAPPLSSHECIEAEHEQHRVCFFNDVFFWHGTMYYVANDTGLVLPRVSTRFGASDDRTGWLNPVVVSPDAVRLDQAEMMTLGAGEGEDVYLWSTLPENNWFHQAGEYMPTLSSTLCKYLGRCYYNQTRGMQLVEVYPDLSHITWAPWVKELVTCYSDTPKITVQHADVFEKVLYIKRALAGVGPECRARMFCNGDVNFPGFRYPVQPQQLALHRRRMGECLGWDHERQAQVDPINMVVIDRHYTSSRHILNIGQIMELLKERYGSIAKISLHYMEGMTAREQIHLWASADLVVHVHGATQGSWQFLPGNATVVHIVQHPGGVIHDNQYADQWVSDLHDVTNITYFPVNNLDMAYAHIKQEVVWKHPEWQQLTAEEKLRVMETGSCDLGRGDEIKHHCLMWWMHKNLNLVMRPELLLPQVDAAVVALYAKLGRPLPPGFPPAPFSTEAHRRKRQLRSRRMLLGRLWTALRQR